jgi:sugar lactone lactonase YvrE
LPINATSIVLQGVFNPNPANNSVTFNDGAVGTVTNATATTLTVTLNTPPANLGNLTAIVTTAGTSTGAPVQVATVVPVTTFTAAAVPINATTITINGSGFDPVAANNSVIFSNGAVGTVTSASSTQLMVTLTTMPTVVGPLTATVTTDGFTSAQPVQIALIQPSAQFTVSSETVDAADGEFGVAVTLVGTPSFASGNSASIQTFASNLDQITAMRFDPAGNLYVVDYSISSIFKVAPDGTVGYFATGLNSPKGLAIDPDGNVYVGNSSKNSITRISPSGGSSTFISGLISPGAMAFDGAGNLYVAVTAGNGAGNIINKVTPSGLVSVVAPGFSSFYDLVGFTFDKAGNFYCISAPNTITKITPAGVATTFTQGFGWVNLSDLGFDSAGNLFASSTSSTPLGFMAPDGTIHQVNSSLSNTNSIAFDAAGNLYAGSTLKSTISKVLPA